MHHNEAWAGQINTEQAVAIIDAVGEAIPAQPVPVTPEQSYWWWLSLAIIPVVLTWWLNKRKK